MAEGESIRLRAIQPTGPVQVAETDLPAGQHQPGPGPYRGDRRSRGQRSERPGRPSPYHSRLTVGEVAALPVRPSIWALERHQRRMARRIASLGRSMVRPAGWGAVHTQRLAGQETPRKVVRRAQTPPRVAAWREALYRRDRAVLTPAQEKAIRRARNRALAQETAPASKPRRRLRVRGAR